MSRASLVRTAIELAKTVRDSRGLLAKALQQEDVVKVFALCDEILKRLGVYLAEGGATVEAYRAIQLLAGEARNLLDRAVTGRSSAPLRSLQGSDTEESDTEEADDEQEAGDEQNLDENPANLDQEEDPDIESASGARFPSEIKLPSSKPPKARRARASRRATRRAPLAEDDEDGIAKSLGSDLVRGVASARLAGILTADETMSALLPVKRRHKESAVFNTPR